jgi:hypothetical protein
MRNFHRLAQGLTVAPLMTTLMRHPELWDADTTRTGFQGSPHREASDILLRFGRASLDDMGPFDNRPAMTLLGAMSTALGVMQMVGGSELGRVLLTRLPPGGKILPHADEGAYARRMVRHQLMIQCLPGNVFRCAGEELAPVTGDLFWFNNALEHEVTNNSADDRIAMVIDARIDAP